MPYLSTGSNPVHHLHLIQGPSQNSLIPWPVLDLPGAVSLNGACVSTSMIKGIWTSYLVCGVSQSASGNLKSSQDAGVDCVDAIFFCLSKALSPVFFHSSCWGIATWRFNAGYATLFLWLPLRKLLFGFFFFSRWFLFLNFWWRTWGRYFLDRRG